MSLKPVMYQKIVRKGRTEKKTLVEGQEERLERLDQAKNRL